MGIAIIMLIGGVAALALTSLAVALYKKFKLKVPPQEKKNIHRWEVPGATIPPAPVEKLDDKKETGQRRPEERDNESPNVNNQTVLERIEEVKTSEEEAGTSKESKGDPTLQDRSNQSGQLKRREPGKKGGRPRGTTYKDSNTPRQPYTLRPEIVCWKRGRQWAMAAEIPDELLQKTGLTVLQSGAELIQEESEESLWPLTQVSGQVTVRWNEGEVFQEVKVELGHNDFLLFKLCGRNLNQGRLVKSISSGAYLVIAPEDWRRDEMQAGVAPIAPEPVSLHGYAAHFFDLEEGNSRKIGFRLPDGKSVCIEKKGRLFELVGDRIDDATEEKGPLFCGGAPRIVASDRQLWKDVKTIVIGQEGGGRGKWRLPFKPNSKTTEQQLPSEVAERKGGWYFLRFYNDGDELMESMDFRFLRGLKQVRIQHYTCFPAAKGHQPVIVEFHYDPDCTVRQISNAKAFRIQNQKDKTIVTIPSDPTWDRSIWLVSQNDGPEVEVTIIVKRIWWALGLENTAPSSWQDRSVTLSREEFRATSTKALWLRLPKRSWVDKLLVGFELSRARPYPVRAKDTTVAIPLREFSDAKEVVDDRDEHFFKIWVERKGLREEAVVAILSASRSSEPEGLRSLNLDIVSASQLATMLSSLRREAAGPLRLLIKEVRRKYRREKTASRKDLVEFKVYALCLIAFLKRSSQETATSKFLNAKQALLAARNFPEITKVLQQRFDDIKFGKIV
ncbi:MAG: hypothetical protein RML93_07130 [Anaerolineales bacterium]|nr:hypothetical protein [Anaerolineales bacterium]MDW8447046.1 hypothetical protein [Anaerolineales bacterium]